MSGSERAALFISHAYPEDNQFTIWLGAKLAALGYEVWADVMRLHGGHDWQRKLEEALRQQTCKVLLVASARAVDKQVVRNEIQIAYNVARTIGDSEFIIPLRLEAFESPIPISPRTIHRFPNRMGAGSRRVVDYLGGRIPGAAPSR